MSSNAAPTSTANEITNPAPVSAEDKGKEKAPAVAPDVDEEMDDDEEDDDDDDDDDMEDDDDEEEEDDENAEEKIDPHAILPRRTRGNVVDYTSEAALSKAGLTAKDLEEDPDASMDASR